MVFGVILKMVKILFMLFVFLGFFHLVLQNFQVIHYSNVKWDERREVSENPIEGAENNEEGT